MTQATEGNTTKKEELERKRLDDTLFKILEDHLLGVGRGILRARLEDLCNDEKQGGKDALTLYQEAHISKENANKLMRLLCVSSEFKEPDTLFGWIKTLSQKDYGHRHLEDFYYLLQEVNPRKSWAMPLFLTTVATAFSAIYFSIRPSHMQIVEDFIQRLMPIVGKFFSTTFSVLRNFPLTMIIYNAAIVIPRQAFSAAFYDTFRTPFKRFQKWLTGTLTSALSLTAYALCYAAKGVFTPAAVGFAIASSLVDVVNSFFNFSQLRPIGDEPLVSAPLEEKLDYIRQKERQARTAKTVGVNLVASLFISLSVLLWAFLPPSFPIVIGSIVFITLVEMTKKATLNYIHTKSAERVQKELHETFVDNEPSAEKTPEPSLEKSSMQAVLESLQETNQKLNQLGEEVQTLKTSLKPKGWFEWCPSFFSTRTEDQAEHHSVTHESTASL